MGLATSDPFVPSWFHRPVGLVAGIGAPATVSFRGFGAAGYPCGFQIPGGSGNA